MESPAVETPTTPRSVDEILYKLTTKSLTREESSKYMQQLYTIQHNELHDPGVPYFECEGRESGALDVPGLDLSSLKNGYTFIVSLFFHKHPTKLSLFSFHTSDHSKGIDATIRYSDARKCFCVEVRAKGVNESRWDVSSFDLSYDVKLNQWYDIVLSHTPASLLKKSRVTVYVNGCKAGDKGLLYPILYNVDKCSIGSSFEGRFASPTLMDEALDDDQAKQCSRFNKVQPVLNSKLYEFVDHLYLPWRKIRADGIDVVSSNATNALPNAIAEYFHRETHESVDINMPAVLFRYDASTCDSALSEEVVNGMQVTRGGVCSSTQVLGRYCINDEAFLPSDPVSDEWSEKRKYCIAAAPYTASTTREGYAMLRSKNVKAVIPTHCQDTLYSIFNMQRLLVLLLQTLPNSFQQRKLLYCIVSNSTVELESVIELILQRIFFDEHYERFREVGGFALVGWVLCKSERHKLTNSLVDKCINFVRSVITQSDSTGGSLDIKDVDIFDDVGLLKKSRMLREVIFNPDLWYRASNEVQQHLIDRMLLYCMEPGGALFLRVTVGVQRTLHCLTKMACVDGLLKLIKLMLTRCSTIAVPTQKTSPRRLVKSLLSEAASRMKLPGLNRIVSNESEVVEEDVIGPSQGELHSLLMFVSTHTHQKTSILIMQYLASLLTPALNPDLYSAKEANIALQTKQAIEVLGGVDFLLGIGSQYNASLQTGQSQDRQESESSAEYYGLLAPGVPTELRAHTLLLIGNLMKLSKTSDSSDRLSKQLSIVARCIFVDKKCNTFVPLDLLQAGLDVLLSKDTMKEETGTLSYESASIALSCMVPVVGLMIGSLAFADDEIKKNAKDIVLKLSIVLKSSPENRRCVVLYPQWPLWFAPLLTTENAGDEFILGQVISDIIVLLLEHEVVQDSIQHTSVKTLYSACLKACKEKEREKLAGVLQKARENEHGKFLIPEYNTLAENKAKNIASFWMRNIILRLWLKISSIQQDPVPCSQELIRKMALSLDFTSQCLLSETFPLQLSPLSRGGVLSTSHGTTQHNTTQQSTIEYSIRNLFDGQSHTKFVFFENERWIQYRYPSTVVLCGAGGATRCRHRSVQHNTTQRNAEYCRVVFYTIQCACDKQYNDPTGFVLYGRNGEDADYCVLDKRENVVFQGRFSGKHCWVQNPGLYEEYKIEFFNNSGKSLQVGGIELYECDLSHWHQPPHNATQHNSNTTEEESTMSEYNNRNELVVFLQKGVECVKWLCQSRQDKSLFRFVCHSLCYSTDDTLTTLCIDTLQIYLHKNLHPHLVFIAIYSLQRCSQNTTQNKNTIDLCNALTVALINTTPFESTPHNTIQHNTTQQSTTKHNTTRHNTIELSLSEFRNDNNTFLENSLELLYNLQWNAIQQVLQNEVLKFNKLDLDKQIGRSVVFVNAFGSKAVGLPRNIRYRVNVFLRKEVERSKYLSVYHKTLDDRMLDLSLQILCNYESQIYSIGIAAHKIRSCLFKYDTTLQTLRRDTEANPHLGAAFGLLSNTPSEAAQKKVVQFEFEEIGKVLSSAQEEGEHKSADESESQTESNPVPSDSESSFDESQELNEKIIINRKKLTEEGWVNRSLSHLRLEWTGPWPKVEDGEIVHLAVRAHKLTASTEIVGRLILTSSGLYFDPDPPDSTQYTTCNTTPLTQHDTTQNEIKWKQDLVGEAKVESQKAEKREIRARRVGREFWPYAAIDRVLLRRWRMRDQACEIFSKVLEWVVEIEY